MTTVLIYVYPYLMSTPPPSLSFPPFQFPPRLFSFPLLFPFPADPRPPSLPLPSGVSAIFTIYFMKQGKAHSAVSFDALRFYHKKAI